MKFYTIYMIVVSGFLVGLDKELLSFFLAVTSATCVRLLFEKVNNKTKFSIYKMALIIIVSTFLPYALYEWLKDIEYFDKLLVFALFIIGFLSLTIVEVLMKVFPKILESVLNLIPESIKKYTGIKK